MKKIIASALSAGLVFGALASSVMADGGIAIPWSVTVLNQTIGETGYYKFDGAGSRSRVRTLTIMFMLILLRSLLSSMVLM